MKRKQENLIPAYKNLSRRVNNSIIGTVSELRAAVSLFKHGYHVFRALSPACPCDLIGLKSGKLTTFEVRTGSIVKGSGKIFVERTKEADVLVIVLRNQIIYEPPI